MAFETKIKLTDEKVLTVDGAKLTLSGDTRIPSNGTLAYVTDQKSSYTARSVVDAGYVTGLTTTSGVQTANNGLTKTGTNVKLGGALTEFVNLSYTGNPTDLENKGFGVYDPNNWGFQVGRAYQCDDIYLGDMDVTNTVFEKVGRSGIGLHANNSGQTNITTFALSCTGNIAGYVANGANSTQVAQTGTNIKVSGTAGFKGIEYCGNYSANYSPRSLVDAAYVTGKTAGLTSAFTLYTGTTAPATYVGKTAMNTYSGATNTRINTIEGQYLYTAQNGLTEADAHTVELGGNITKNTNIVPTGAFAVTLGTATNFTKVTTDCTNIQNQTGNVINAAMVNASCSGLMSSDAVAGKFAFQTLCSATPAISSNVINSGSSLTVCHQPNSYSIRGCAAFPGFQYFADYSANFTDRSLVDKGYVCGLNNTMNNRVTTIEGQYVTGGTNGVSKIGTHAVELGGALTKSTILAGSQTFGVNATTVQLTGSSAVNLGGTVALKTVPAGIGAILCRNASTGAIELTSVTALGGLTGATNGISKDAYNRVKLGGALTETTTLTGNYALNLCNGAGIVARTAADIVLDGESGAGVILVAQSGTSTNTNGAVGVGIIADFDSSNGLTIFNNKPNGGGGIHYAADYSSSYDQRSLVDKYYVDSIATGLQVHAAVWVATTGSITLSGAQTIDGIAVTNGMRVLVKDQNSGTGSTNGVYVASTTGAWARAEDFNFTPAGEVTNGDLVPVTSGSTNNNSIWVLTTPNPISEGDPLIFTKFSTIVDVVAGDGINVAMNGGVHTVSAALYPTVSALKFCNHQLAVDPLMASSGLTWCATTGKINVNASQVAVSGTVLPVKFNGASHNLAIDSTDVNTALGTPINTANNGLTKTGSNVKLGGTLAEATSISIASDTNSLTITDTAGTKRGIVYAGNYSADFGGNSLVSGQFVTGITSALDTRIGTIEGQNLDSRVTDIEDQYVTGATNGLTKLDAHNFKLGGCLTENTVIETTPDYTFEIKGAPSTAFFSVGDGGAGCTDHHVVIKSMCRTEVCGTKAVTIAGQDLSLNFCGTGVITDVNGVGLAYATDYSDTFGDNSLVSKLYVDNAAGAIQASNGLNRTGDEIMLGGELLNTTKINIGANSLIVTGSSLCTGLYLDNTRAILGNYDGNAYLGIRYDGSNNIEGWLSNGGTNNSQMLYSPTCIENKVCSATKHTIISQDANMIGFCGLINIVDDPAAGAVDDMILVRDMSGQIQQITVATVTGATAIFGSNGLTRNGDLIELGGELTKDTYLNGYGNYRLELGRNTVGQNFTCINLAAANGTCAEGGFDVDFLKVNGSCSVNTIESVVLGGLTNNDQALPTSLAVMQYVTGQTTTTGVQTADNGLTKDGTNVQLGGTLTQDTDIVLGSNTLTLDSTYFTTDDIWLGTSDNTYLEVTSGFIDMWANGPEFELDGGVKTIKLGTENYGGAHMLFDGTNNFVCVSNTLGTQKITVGGTNTTVTGTLSLATAPATGVSTDAYLVRASDGTIKTISTGGNIYSQQVVTGASTTLTASSPYLILVNYVNPATITLPASPSNGQAFKIKDASGNALVNNITIAGNGNTIDGASSATINTDSGALELAYNQALDKWFVLSFVN